jgi:hypothetical protein
MGLDLLPILPRTLPSGSAVAVVGPATLPKRPIFSSYLMFIINEEDSPTFNLPIWPLDGALDKGRRFGGRRWCQGKTS